MRCESWMTSSPSTMTGTQSWPVRSWISSRCERRCATRTCSKSAPALRNSRATRPHAQSQFVGVRHLYSVVIGDRALHAAGARLAAAQRPVGVVVALVEELPGLARVRVQHPERVEHAGLRAGLEDRHVDAVVAPVL